MPSLRWKRLTPSRTGNRKFVEFGKFHKKIVTQLHKSTDFWRTRFSFFFSFLVVLTLSNVFTRLPNFSFFGRDLGPNLTHRQIAHELDKLYDLKIGPSTLSRRSTCWRLTVNPLRSPSCCTDTPSIWVSFQFPFVSTCVSNLSNLTQIWTPVEISLSLSLFQRSFLINNRKKMSIVRWKDSCLLAKFFSDPIFDQIVTTQLHNFKFHNFKTGRAAQGMPRVVKGAKIACIDFDLRKSRMQMGVQVWRCTQFWTFVWPQEFDPKIRPQLSFLFSTRI